jgi:hypothetical protein
LLQSGQLHSPGAYSQWIQPRTHRIEGCVVSNAGIWKRRETSCLCQEPNPVSSVRLVTVLTELTWLQSIDQYSRKIIPLPRIQTKFMRMSCISVSQRTGRHVLLARSRSYLGGPLAMLELLTCLYGVCFTRAILK